MTLSSFFKWIGGGLVALTALLCLFLQGVYWCGAAQLPSELPQPRRTYPAPARVALWRMIGDGETALSVRKLNIFSYAGNHIGFIASYSAGSPTKLPAVPADLTLLQFTGNAVSAAIRRARKAQSPPVPQAAPTSNAEALQQVSYQDQLEPVALLIRISREWPPERMADMVLGTLDYGRDSEGLEQAARTYFGTAVEDLSSPELSMLMAIALRSGNRDPYCYPEQFLENYDEHFDRPWTRALPAISVASSARLKPVDCKKQP